MDSELVKEFPDPRSMRGTWKDFVVDRSIQRFQIIVFVNFKLFGSRLDESATIIGNGGPFKICLWKEE